MDKKPASPQPPTGHEDSETPPALHWFAMGLAAATFLLVIAGGLVTSTGSALAVPDWPLAFGQFFPPMVGGVLFEHGHRMIAATIGLLTIIFSVCLWRSAAPRVVKNLSLWAIGAVCLQGLLGGLTVLLKLPLVISVSHACLGQAFFCIMVSLAVLTARGALRDDIVAYKEAKKLQRLALMTTGFIFLQLIVGAIYRHSGKIFHVHLLGAFLVALHAILLSRRILTELGFGPELRTPALMLINLVGFQIALGWFAWRMPLVFMTTAHVATGALVLATSVILTLQSYLRVENV
jgi:heme A synthase